MRTHLGLLFIVAAGTALPQLASRKPTAKEKVALGLLAVDLTLEENHGFYNGDALLDDLRLGQRLAQRKPISNDEVVRAFRAQGYVQGLLDGLLDGVNGESMQRQVDAASRQQLKGKIHPALCIANDLGNINQVLTAVVESLQRLTKDVRQQSAHMVVADTLLSEDTRFIVPCSP